MPGHTSWDYPFLESSRQFPSRYASKPSHIRQQSLWKDQWVGKKKSHRKPYLTYYRSDWRERCHCWHLISWQGNLVRNQAVVQCFQIIRREGPKGPGWKWVEDGFLGQGRRKEVGSSSYIPVDTRFTLVLFPSLAATVVASSTPAGPLPTTITVLLPACSSISTSLCVCREDPAASLTGYQMTSASLSPNWEQMQ